MYLHIIPTAGSTKVVNSSYFRSKANAASTVDTPSHDCFYQWSNIFIFYSPKIQMQTNGPNMQKFMACYLSNFFFKYTKAPTSVVYFHLFTNQISKLYVQNGRYPGKLTPLYKFTADICKIISIKPWLTSKF
jgi:hypothetical protein